MTQVDDDRSRCCQGQSFRRVPVDGRGGQAQPALQDPVRSFPTPPTTSDSCWPVCTLTDVLSSFFLTVVSSRREPFFRTNNNKKLLVYPPLVSRDSLLLPLLSFFARHQIDSFLPPSTFAPPLSKFAAHPPSLSLPPLSPEFPSHAAIQNAVFDFALVEQKSERGSSRKTFQSASALEFSVLVRTTTGDGRLRSTITPSHR